MNIYEKSRNNSTETEKIKRGRPFKKDARRRLYHVRLNDEEENMIKELSIKLEISGSDVLRNGLILINHMYNFEKDN